MSRFVELLKKVPFFLMVSLPKNDLSMAKAAEAEGAMAIKVHLNVHHPASKIKFGTFGKEQSAIQKILDNVKIPVGVVPGGDTFASYKELFRLQEMSVDFFDAFLRHFPACVLRMEKVGKMAALGEEYTISMIEQLHCLGVEVIEATIFNPKVYGNPLVLRDIVKYREISSHTPVPVLVPTQKKIKPEETALLKAAGCRGIVIGAVVTGTSCKSLAKIVREFRAAINKLNQNE